jgi:hypothetical protein
MNATRLFSRSRLLVGLAAAGTALLSAGSASAQTATPFYAFVVNNLTESGGTAFPVQDSVNFASTQVNEVFADGFTQSLSFQDAYSSSAGTVTAQDIVPSSLQTFSFAGGTFADPAHGALTSATLTGTLVFPGFPPTKTLSLTVQTDAAGDTVQQSVFTPFSASLFGPASSGVAVGTFSLLNLGSGQGTQVTINATPVPAAVPEASTTASLGLLLALGLGGLAAARRKRTTAHAN